MSEATKKVIQKGFVVDGKVFATNAEAQDYIRRPQISAALQKLTNNQELTDWLLDNIESVEAAFDTGTIRRVTKAERNKLEKSLEAVKIAAEGGNKALAYVAEVADTILEVFRWPTVKRLKDEEKAAAIKVALNSLTDNPELSDWIIENEKALMESFEAGKEKRIIPEGAAEGLQAYRDKMKKRKEELEAAKAEGPEAVEKVLAKHKAEKEAEEKAKADAKAAKEAAKAAKE